MIFKYIKAFYAWIEENPEKANPMLIAVYFAIINKANKDHWKGKYVLILSDIQETSGISSRTTVIKWLNELEQNGFIQTVSYSKNQYKNRVACLPLNENLLESTWKADEKQLESTWTHNKTLKPKEDLKDFEDFNGEKKIKPEPKQKKNKEVFFRDSQYFENPELFCSDWYETKTAAEHPQIDPLTLYDSIKLTTDATDKYKYANWIAAAQNWAKRDPKQYYARTGIEQFSRGTQELHRRNETLSQLAYDPITGRPWDE